MNRRFFRTALFCLAAFSPVRADQAIESIQQKLKDQGFYYGEINGKKDADTTAAIRRYQIRNGLQITGEINAETQRSLGITYTAPSTPRPRPTATPFPDKPTLRQNQQRQSRCRLRDSPPIQMTRETNVSTCPDPTDGGRRRAAFLTGPRLKLRRRMCSGV